MDKPAVPIGMRFGAEIECFIKLPDGIKLREIKDGHRMKFPGEKGQELFASSSLSVAYWLLAKYETWANGKQVFGIAVNPTDFWLKSEAKSLNKDQENEKYAKRKDCWGIELDGSLDSTVETLYKREIFPFEFVSSPIPVIFSTGLDPFQPAQNALSTFFQFFADEGITVYSRSSSSMHIHLTPLFDDGGVDWTFETIKSIGLCSAWFESALRHVLPKSRRKNLFCIEYYNNVSWLKEDANWPRPESSSGLPIMTGLIDHMSAALPRLDRLLKKDNSIENLCKLLQAGGENDRYAAWNFYNMYKNKRGEKFAPIKTIEFRQPPGCASAAEALDWIKYAVIFSMQACKFGGELFRLMMDEYPNNPTPVNRKTVEKLYDCSDQGLQEFLAREDEAGKSPARRVKFNVAGLILRQTEFRFVLELEKRKLEAPSPAHGPGLPVPPTDQIPPAPEMTWVAQRELEQVLRDYEEEERKKASHMEKLKREWADQTLAAEDAAILEAIKKTWFGTD